jgi:hypothetical protein
MNQRRLFVRLCLPVALAVTCAPRPARAEKPLAETAAGIAELTAPVARIELRFDVGALATLPAGGDRVDARLEIAPRPDYWYGIGVSSITAPPTTTTTINGDGSVSITSTLTEGVTLSARIFKRLGPLVASAGVVDNRGGVGLELRGLDDRLRLEALLAEWTPADARAIPTLRLGASAQWWHLYVQAGLLDALDRPRASAYAGLGLRWRDTDLPGVFWWLRR